MTVHFVESRRGRRGHPVSDDRARRMEAIVDEVAGQPIAITARHLFYRLVSRGDVIKTERGYQLVLDDLLALRRSGDVPWSAITDGTRLKTRWIGYASLEEAAVEWARTYRRDLWRTNWATCEVWTESRGLLATINEVAAEYGVTTLGVGGFNSASVGWETAQDVKRAVVHGQSFFVFHFGDHDPSGRAIGRSAEREIRSHLAAAEQARFEFVVCALTAEQVRDYALPSAPVKRTAAGRIRGGHAGAWDGGTTELDALDPLILQRLVRAAITGIIDSRALDAVRVAEESERSVLASLTAALSGRDGPA